MPTVAISQPVAISSICMLCMPILVGVSLRGHWKIGTRKDRTLQDTSYKITASTQETGAPRSGEKTSLFIILTNLRDLQKFHGTHE